MIRLIDLETDEEFAEFDEILTKVRSGNIVGTLRQAVKKPNNGESGDEDPSAVEYTYVDLQQAVSSAKTLVQINGNYLYITVQDVHNEDIRKILTMWNMILQRGTQRFLKGEANDYLLTIDLVRDEVEKEGITYCISAIQPIFATNENSRVLTFVFELANVRCTKDEVSIYDVEYEASLREASGDDVYKISADYEDEDEDEGFEENTDVLNNDRYTTGISQISGDEQ